MKLKFNTYARKRRIYSKSIITGDATQIFLDMELSLLTDAISILKDIKGISLKDENDAARLVKEIIKAYSKESVNFK